MFGKIVLAIMNAVIIKKMLHGKNGVSTILDQLFLLIMML